MFLQKVFGRKQRKVVIVQCRLSSTRLPRKALLLLGGKTVLEWVLLAMRQVKADKYYLATDIDSEAELAPIAKEMRWELYAGSKTDVLERFVEVINISKADIVLRATADNPFLFYEAAQDLLDDFMKRYEGDSENEATDYMTYSGLPHGSGVEVFNAHSLVKASSETDSSFDHEHVGPALYNHRDKYNCLFVRAPERYYFPKFRTTIDTAFDYKRALQIVNFVSGKEIVKSPYVTQQIVLALKEPYIKNQILFIPCVEKGCGTGHLRRCLELAFENKNDIYIPLDASLKEIPALVKEYREKGLEDFQIIRNLNGIENYSLVVTDLFKTDKNFAFELEKKCCVLALDEGSGDSSWADYILDIIPGINENSKRLVNCTEHSFLNLPENVRSEEEKTAAVHNAIVVFGGEDPSDLTLKASICLAENSLFTTAVFSSEEKINEADKKIPNPLKKYIKFSLPIENLREQLFKYDLVVSHYGFTAFEAAKALCHVLLVSSTELHKKLSLANGFFCISPKDLTGKKITQILKSPENLFKILEGKKNGSLGEFIGKISTGEKRLCPVCARKETYLDALVARTSKRTYRRCSNCSIIYMSWSVQEESTSYNHDYFFDDYKKQYGKTYLEDFESIKAQGIRRISIIDFLYRKKNRSINPSLLDVGCAMGPFLAAASNAMWQVFGIDVSSEAVEYVKNTLSYPAVCGEFPFNDIASQFGVKQFDALTMWFVIEHFSDLDSVLSAVSSLVKKGGIFAFSTPNALGVSGKYNKQNFYENSPQDHYSIWETKTAKSILKKYGFKVVKIVPTGIHPERFPNIKNHGSGKNTVRSRTAKTLSKIFCLGDTFEIYCRKI